MSSESISFKSNDMSLKVKSVCSFSNSFKIELLRIGVQEPFSVTVHGL